MSLLAGLIVIGVVLWLVNSIFPIDSKIKPIINAVVVLIVCLWLLQAFGILAMIPNVPRLR